MFDSLVIVVAILIPCFIAVPEPSRFTEEEAKRYLEVACQEIAHVYNEVNRAEWEYSTSLSEGSFDYKMSVNTKLAEKRKQVWINLSKFPWKTFKDADLRRQCYLLSFPGQAILPKNDREKLEVAINYMEYLYGTATISHKENKNLTMFLEPDLTGKFKASKDIEELKYYWAKWHSKIGKKVNTIFTDYVHLSNQAARLNGFINNAEFWIHQYEEPATKFEKEMEHLWTQLEPLYKQLHAYVRKKLFEIHGNTILSRTGPIPAHLLAATPHTYVRATHTSFFYSGDITTQFWDNLYEITVPYKKKTTTDVTPQLIEQKYTPLKMFKISEEFFLSLNLSAMTKSFWINSIIEKPKHRKIICDSTAWDFCDGEDYRIKLCTKVEMGDLFAVHHEMGHIQYYMQYRHQPLPFRSAPNPGFQEAVGELISLSVMSLKHLRKIGLLQDQPDDPNVTINNLFRIALDRIAFLPYTYLIDLWRWGVFNNSITPDNYNENFWKLRLKYQGVGPSVTRYERDFDPGSEYSIISDLSYIRYFVGTILHFQFHRALCIAAGQYDPSNPTMYPLHDCDIYQSTKAGNLLRKMLQMGNSKHWSIALKIITGKSKLDAGPLLEYFQPLMKWLEVNNAETGELIGWHYGDRYMTAV
uniref:Angiotensin-converting enzyme n=1 Tax=Clastoptera arizonana TaxID=38151 RepID=A0A1B6E7P2_9HEMI